MGNDEHYKTEKFIYEYILKYIEVIHMEMWKVGVVMVLATILVAGLVSADEQVANQTVATNQTLAPDEVENEAEFNATVENVETLEKETTQPPEKSIDELFQIPPVVRVKFTNDIVTKKQPGIIEFYMSNPTVNEIPLVVEVYLQVPSGVHITGEGLSYDVGGGTLHGYFKLQPGISRTVVAEVTGEKVGEFSVKAIVFYYPEGHKEQLRQTVLTHPFTIKQPVVIEEGQDTISFTEKEALFGLLSILSVVLLVFGIVALRRPKIEIRE